MLCEKDLGENQVENQNHDAAHDDRLRTGAAYLERVAVGVIAVKARNGRDDECERRRLDQRVSDLKRLEGVLDTDCLLYTSRCV